jgi:hypothetical protein
MHLSSNIFGSFSSSIHVSFLIREQLLFACIKHRHGAIYGKFIEDVMIMRATLRTVDVQPLRDWVVWASGVPSPIMEVLARLLRVDFSRSSVDNSQSDCTNQAALNSHGYIPGAAMLLLVTIDEHGVFSLFTMPNSFRPAMECS